MVARPYCGKLLASLGAQVIKAEAPMLGDPSRRRGPFPGDLPHPERSGLFLYLNTGKKSITLELQDEQGQALLGQLLGRADVIIHDCQPGSAASIGLDLDTLEKTHPDLIIAPLTPFGGSGPYSDYQARQINVFHGGGEGYLLPNGLALDTFPDRAPLMAGGQMGSYQGGITAAVGVLAAVYARQCGVPGQVVDCSMQEAQLAIGYLPFQRLQAEGLVEDRFFRVGGVLTAQDGYVELLTLESRQWQALAELLGRPDWAVANRFEDPSKYGSEINAHLREWSKNHTKEWLYQQGQALGVPIAPYFAPAEVFYSRQRRHREFFTSLDHPEAGCYEYAGLPYRFSQTPERLTRAPLLGEHNREVYESLGYPPQDLGVLARAGVI